MNSKKYHRAPPPMDQNNILLKKLKKRFKLKDADLWHVWNLGGMDLSKNAAKTFTQPFGHKNYRKCDDESFVKFIDGLTRFLNGAVYDDF